MITKTVTTKVGEHFGKKLPEEYTITYRVFGVTIYKKHIVLPFKYDASEFHLPFRF